MRRVEVWMTTNMDCRVAFRGILLGIGLERVWYRDIMAGTYTTRGVW